MSNTEVLGTERFYENLARTIATAKRDAVSVIDAQFRGVVRNLLALTPPMGGTEMSLKVYATGDKKGQKTGAVDFPLGKKRGERNITHDVAQAFRPLLRSELRNPAFRRFRDETPEETLAWYIAARKPNKRARRILRPALTRNIAFVRKYLLTRQGTVAAGWAKAAQYFGISLPAWISRWGAGRSKMDVSLTTDGYYLTAVNANNVPEMRKNVDRIKMALQAQSNNMERVIEKYIHDSAKSLGFKTS